MKSVCVFCGSSGGARPSYSALARTVGGVLARRGIALVYGGGNVGLMGVVADAALDAGGRVIGVIPHALADKELAHPGVREMHVVRTMHERKQLMADLSDAFVALPGGFGTLDELCEMLTWWQLGIQAKPCGILDVDGYWDPLRALFDRAVNEGFVQRESRERIVEDHDAERLIDRLALARVGTVRLPDVR